MSELKYKLEVHITVDPLEYPIPADTNLALSLKEDIQEAIESAVCVEVNAVKIIKTGGKIKNETYDTDEP